ncbi:MAG TPA: hypothetical protein VLH85_05495 [Levilinea sp.]|nr:hypothetical protein [Levilinea sp.]
MSKRILLSIIVLAVVFCIGLSLVLIPGAFMLAAQNLGLNQDAAQATPTRTPVVLPTSTPGSNLPADIERQMDQIQVEVMKIRGLTLNAPLLRDVLSPEELQDRVAKEFFADYTDEEAGHDAALFHVWGFLQADFDLVNFFKALYSEQVAGYYDSETKEMYVVLAEGFFGNERMTYAHEFAHVLQDQTFDLRNGMLLNSEYCEENTEYCAAVTALVEGDATKTQLAWFWQYATPQDQQQVQQASETFESPVFDTAPGFIQEDLLFPYIYGLEFVQSLYDRGGWEAIDAAYANPPVSTEQILHPDRYPSDLPVLVVLPDLGPILGDGWTEIVDDVMGQWSTYLVLTESRDSAAQLPAEVARIAAAGWGGDAYAAFSFDDTGQILLLHRWLWDTSADATEFWDAFSDYSRARWGDPDSSTSGRMIWEETPYGWVAVVRSGDEVLWLIAPNAEVAAQILDQMPEFQE